MKSVLIDAISGTALTSGAPPHRQECASMLQSTSGRPSDLAERVENFALGQDLRQNGRRARPVVEQVERHAAAAKLLQKSGDIGVLPRPVTLQRDDMAVGKGVPHRRAVQGRMLVDETGQAPG